MRTLIAVLLAATFFIGAPVLAAEVEVIDKDELKQILGSEDLILLDVRAGGDWNSSQFKIQGALREDPNDVESWAANYSKDKNIVLYCA
jgi:rhodanese-related sulfurtransferase